MDDKKKELREALWKLAVGCEVTEKEVIRSKSGKDERIRVKTRHVPPDLKAWNQVMSLIAMGEW
jgi:hypothetical protein